MTKKEILSDNRYDVLQGMDEYAEQQCIAFIEWAIENHSVSYEGFGIPVWIYTDGEMREYNVKELYQLFIKEQNSKV